MRRWQRQWPHGGDDALRRCAIMPTGMPQVAPAPVGMGGAFNAFPPMPPLVVHPVAMDDDMAAPNNVGEEAHQIAGGLVGSPLPVHGIHPVDCTLEEARRLISARTHDRSFVALLNEAMAVVLPGEPISRAKADRVKMLVDAVHQG